MDGESRGWAGEGEPPGSQGEAGAGGGEKVRDGGDPIMHEAGMRGERKEGVLGGSLAPVWGAVFRNGEIEINLGFPDTSCVRLNAEAS